MPEGIELYHKDGRPTEIFYCSGCRIVYLTKNQADLCCGERLCECGRPSRNRYDKQCNECSNREWKEKCDREEMARYEKATKIQESEWKGEQCFYDDRYFEDVTEAVEHAEADGGWMPEYIWAAKNQGIPRACMEDLLTNIVDNMWEDADYDDLEGIPELEAAIETFNEANKGTVVWMVDYSTAIVLEPKTVPC